MACISQSQKGWRAQVYVNGIRKSKMLRTKREAKIWAYQQEMELRQLHQKRKEFYEKLGVEELSNLPDILSLRMEVPAYPGIYFLMLDEEIIYIGKSTNVLTRLAAHIEKGRKFTHFYAIPYPVEELDKKEQYYIDLLKPSQNKNSIIPALSSIS